MQKVVRGEAPEQDCPALARIAALAAAGPERFVHARGVGMIESGPGGCPEVFRDHPDLAAAALEAAILLLGEVQRPGLHPVARDVTLADLLAVAGGVSDTADLRNVELSRVLTVPGATTAPIERLPLDITSRNFAAVRVSPRDTVRFARLFIDRDLGPVRLAGEFVRPGLYEIRRDERRRGLGRSEMRLNARLVWRPIDGVELSAGFVHGKDRVLRASLIADPASPPRVLPTPVLPPPPRPDSRNRLARRADRPPACRRHAADAAFGRRRRTACRAGADGPFDPLSGELMAVGGGRVAFGHGLSVGGEPGADLIGNLRGRPRPPDTELAPVRTEIGSYLEVTRFPVLSLTAEGIWTVGTDLFARVTAGLLEMMYGGVQGEILWRPVDSRFAIGADLAWVKQRDFDRAFRFRDDETVTGHLSLYVDLPYRDLYAILRAGRYLARDWGATLELGRRFDNGVEIGGFATLTDAGFDKFGEGSFDKGSSSVSRSTCSARRHRRAGRS